MVGNRTSDTGRRSTGRASSTSVPASTTGEASACTRSQKGGHVMSTDDLDDYEAQLELQLYKEYRDVVGVFAYVVETERRFYLANHVDLKAHNDAGDVYFELTLRDAWVWDSYRSARFIKTVHVLTFKDVNIEEIGLGTAGRRPQSTNPLFPPPIRSWSSGRHGTETNDGPHTQHPGPAQTGPGRQGRGPGGGVLGRRRTGHHRTQLQMPPRGTRHHRPRR